MYTAKRAAEIVQEDGPFRLLQKAGTFLRYRGPVGPIYMQYVRWKRTQLSEYDAVADPYRILEVDPDEIRDISGLDYDILEIGTVVDGDWDRSTASFHDYDLYQAFGARFRDGIPWDETEFYRRVRSEIESGEMKFGCESVSELDQRCERIDELYTSIAEHGYLPGEERVSTDPMDDAKRTNYLVPTLDEIKVDIDREGELLFVDGRHRLAIVKVLDLSSVPVLILRRHAQWQATREAIADGGSPDTYLEGPDPQTHPDLQDLHG